MPYLACILTGMVIGIFACVMVCARRPTPPTLYHRRQKPPEVAQVPVVEAGSISYEFINLTGLENE